MGLPWSRASEPVAEQVRRIQFSQEIQIVDVLIERYIRNSGKSSIFDRWEVSPRLQASLAQRE